VKILIQPWLHISALVSLFIIRPPPPARAGLLEL
jgi:hypothetical protein